MSRVFISYKRRDKETVFDLKHQIEERTGVECWVDLAGIHSDEHFVSVIIKAINEAEIILFMYSASHLEIADYEHDYTVMELNYAFNRHKRIVFINLDHTELTDWFLFKFGQKQQVFVDQPGAMDALVEDIRRWLKDSESSSSDIRTVQDAWALYYQAKNRMQRSGMRSGMAEKERVIQTVQDILQTRFDDWNLYFGIAEDFVVNRIEEMDEIARVAYFKAAGCTFKDDEAEMKGRIFVYLGAMYRRTGQLDSALMYAKLGYGILKDLPEAVVSREDALYNLYVIHRLLGQNEECDGVVAELRKTMTEDDIADLVEKKVQRAISSYGERFGHA